MHGSLAAPFVWALGGALASLALVMGATAFAMRARGEHRVERLVRALVASVALLYLGLFGVMFLPLTGPSGDSVAGLALHADLPVALRVVFGLLALSPLTGVAGMAVVATRARTPGRIAAVASQLVALVLVVLVAVETTFVAPEVREHPANLVALAAGSLGALACGITAFFRTGWERFGVATAGTLFAATPFIGQFVAIDHRVRARALDESLGTGAFALAALLALGAGIGWGLVVAPRALRARAAATRPTLGSSLRVVGYWSAGIAALFAALTAGSLGATIRDEETESFTGPRVPEEPPTFPGERYPPTARHTGSLARDAREPWPSKGPWRDVDAEGGFALVLHGAEAQLFPVQDELYVTIHPHLYRAAGDKLVALPEPLPIPGRREYDGLWRDDAGRLALWDDEPRHYGNPSDNAAFYTLSDGMWTPAPELRDARMSGSLAAGRSVRFAGERRLVVRKEGVHWESGGVPEVIGTANPHCKPWWELPFQVAIAGDDTYLSTYKCEEDPSVFRVARDGAVTALASLPISDPWVMGLYPLGPHELVLIGSCARAPRDYSDSQCVLRWDGKAWRDEGEHLDGMDLAATAMDTDGVVWALLAHNGNGNSGLARPRGPVPSGELHRRARDGHWEKVAFPNKPLPNWECLRFAPLALGVAGETAWVSGKWYYVRKPRPDFVEAFVYGGLFRLGAARGPAVSLDPADLAGAPPPL